MCADLRSVRLMTQNLKQYSTTQVFFEIAISSCTVFRLYHLKELDIYI